MVAERKRVDRLAEKIPAHPKVSPFTFRRKGGTQGYTLKEDSFNAFSDWPVKANWQCRPARKG